jgi:prepilin-type processing-associated H-X9-DG protein
MSRLRSSFRPSLEKLDNRLCLSGTPLESVPLVAEPTEMEASHVRVFSGRTYGESSVYGGFNGGVRVGAVDRDGWSVSSPYPGFTGGVFVAAGDLDGGELGDDWLVGGTGRDAGDVRTTAALHLKPPTPTADDDVVVDGKVITAGDDWLAVGAGFDVLIASTGDDRLAAVSDELFSASGTSSSHSGGANFLFADGSVRF